MALVAAMTALLSMASGLVCVDDVPIKRNKHSSTTEHVEYSFVKNGRISVSFFLTWGRVQRQPTQ